MSASPHGWALPVAWLGFQRSSSGLQDLLKTDRNEGAISTVWMCVVLRTAVPVWHQRRVLWKTIFPWTSACAGARGMIQVYYSYCALYFCYYYITFASDHQTLDPRSSDRGTPG